MATLREWISNSKTGVQQLVFICVIVFVPAWLMQMLDLNAGLWWLTYTPSTWVKPWSFITYMFLHVGFFHLLGNMLWLYFVGSILQDLVGPKHIYRLFLGGGILGAVFFQGIYSFSAYAEQGIPFQLLGASGGVSAVVIGTAIFTPRYRLFLFGLVEVELRWIALAKVLLDFGGLASGSNVGGYTAHLGGIAWGAIYVFGVLRGDFLFGLFDFFDNFSARLGAAFQKKSPRNTTLRFEKGNKTVVSNATRGKGGPSEAEVNMILDKISQVGYNNLTAKEKETLFKASKTD